MNLHEQKVFRTFLCPYRKNDARASPCQKGAQTPEVGDTPLEN